MLARAHVRLRSAAGLTKDPRRWNVKVRRARELGRVPSWNYRHLQPLGILELSC